MVMDSLGCSEVIESASLPYLLDLSTVGSAASWTWAEVRLYGLQLGEPEGSGARRSDRELRRHMTDSRQQTVTNPFKEATGTRP